MDLTADETKAASSLLPGVRAPYGGVSRARPVRRETAPQRLGKIEFAPGNSMAPKASNPQYLAPGRAATAIPGNSHRLSPERRSSERQRRPPRQGRRESPGKPEIAPPRIETVSALGKALAKTSGRSMRRGGQFFVGLSVDSGRETAWTAQSDQFWRPSV
jgi:hypothetical protein